MARINKKENNATMSEEMLSNCKSDIAKFGFKIKEYTQFLISVDAMKDEMTVFKYNNDNIEKYREKYLKKNEITLSDGFQLDKFKIMTSDSEGNRWETGYFTPRSFWDFILIKYDYEKNKTY